MSEFDDNEIRDALRRRAGGPTEGFGLEAAHTAVVARAGRVRRRRATIAGGAAMLGLVAAAAFVIGPGSDSVVTNPADRTTGSTAASVDSVVDTTVPTSSEPSTADAVRPPSSSPSPAPTVPSTIPSTTTSTAPSNSVAPSSTAPAAPVTTLTPPPSTDPAPPTSGSTPVSTTTPGAELITKSYESAGGTITVHWDGAALSLLDVSAADGFDSEVEDERADRIRVRFEGDDGESRIEVRVENGEIVRVE